MVFIGIGNEAQGLKRQPKSFGLLFFLFLEDRSLGQPRWQILEGASNHSLSIPFSMYTYLLAKSYKSSP